MTELEDLKNFSRKIGRMKKYDTTLLFHILKTAVIILHNSASQKRTIDRALDAYREIAVLLLGILTLLNPIRC
jgi:hypothetical protein